MTSESSNESISIQPCGELNAQIRPPGSKSITNRALVCAALADGTSTLKGVLESEDTRLMVDGLIQMGFDIRPNWEKKQIFVAGSRGLVPSSGAHIYCGNSGTTIRFLTALAGLGDGTFVLDGDKRMRQRPIGDLVEAMNQLGCHVSDMEGCPPVTVKANGIEGGIATVTCSRSSQYLSGLLMALPYARDFSVLHVKDELVSQPYIEMTSTVMSRFGVDVTQLHEPGEFSVDTTQRFDGALFDIEPDASAASYFLAAAAIVGGTVKVLGLQLGAIQGDVRFAQLLDDMGCFIDSDDEGLTVTGPAKVGIEVDMNDISDTVQSLAAVALFVKGPTRITGIAHNRFKETDRIGNLAIELRKLGAEVNELDDGLEIIPGEVRAATIETYNDHRMAMALSLVGLRCPGVVITNPGCTAKTYPNFFEDLQMVCSSSGSTN